MEQVFHLHLPCVPLLAAKTKETHYLVPHRVKSSRLSDKLPHALQIVAKKWRLKMERAAHRANKYTLQEMEQDLQALD